MNDLEPWKIWAVTGLLVCMILSATAARIRPLGVGEAAAQASTLTTGQRPASVASDQAQSSDLYEAYFSGYSHSGFSAHGYSNPQPISIVSVQDLLMGSSESSGVIDDSYLEAKLDVTQQILGSDSTQFDQIAANNYHPSDYSGTSWNDVLEDPIQGEAVTFNDITTDQLNAAFSPDGTQYTVVLKISSPDGNGFTSINLSGAGDVRVTNMALVADQIKVAFSNVNGNAIASSNAAVFLDAAVTAATSQSQALDSEPQNGPPSGIGVEDFDEIRAQAVEADVLARSESEQRALIRELVSD